jgi:hypothetical protein
MLTFVHNDQKHLVLCQYQQENIEIDQENIDSENTQPEKESVSTNKEHFQPGVFAAVLFPTKKGKSVTVCIGQILDCLLVPQNRKQNETVCHSLLARLQ